VPDAVAPAAESSVQIPNSFLFFRRLKESEAAQDTASAARLVAHILSGATDATLACEEIRQIIYRIADRQPSLPDKRDRISSMPACMLQAMAAPMRSPGITTSSRVT
jgi:hypothetical protein